jgi:uncharacterized membrane protein YdcZ (DUF606 family)
MIFRLPRFEIDQALLLTTSSVVTASLASFTLGVVMIIVVIGESKKHYLSHRGGVGRWLWVVDCVCGEIGLVLSFV